MFDVDICKLVVVLTSMSSFIYLLRSWKEINFFLANESHFSILKNNIKRKRQSNNIRLIRAYT